MELIEERIKANKPNISASSIKTYKSLLKNLYYKHHDKETKMNCDWFDEQDQVIETLKDKPASARKTYLASLMSVAKKNDKYKTLITKDIKETNDFNKTQTKTKTQDENWKDFSQIKEIVDAHYEKVKGLLKSKDVLSKEDFNKLQDFIILALTSGVYIPPRRSQDWVLMKWQNYDKEKDNYLDLKAGKFIFNIYKTSKFYDRQETIIPKAFKAILKKFVSFSKSDYLIINNKNEPFTIQRLTQKLNSLFDGKISTSMLRHIFLSDKLKDIPKLTELENLSNDMGHSVMQQLEYIKK
jgi:hypothetical protein